MDGRRRILRSIRGVVAAAFPLQQQAHYSTPTPMGPVSAYHGASARHYTTAAPSVTTSRRNRRRRLVALMTRPGVGLVASLTLFSLVGLAGWTQNGGYDAFVESNGQPWDIAARFIGFDIAAVTMTGQSRVSEKELLEAAKIGAGQSLPFLDPTAVREHLLALPLVKSARVMKLYPNRLVVTIEEREPYALWQRDGQVFVVSEDGVTIDDLRTDAYLTLPFVVGEGAQKRLPEYMTLLKSAGDLANRVKAGVRVADRRWDLDMTNGVKVRLSEQDPVGSLQTLLRLQHDARILDKDIISIDLRSRDRVSVRLTEEGVISHEAFFHKSHKSGG